MAASDDPRDLYKSILLLRSLPPTFSRLRSGGFAKVLAPCGEIDNNIGGLFGKASPFGETGIVAMLVTSQLTTTSLKYANGIPWVVSLVGVAASFTISVINAAVVSIEVRDDETWNPGTSQWDPLPGNVGVLLDQANEDKTGFDLEAAINTQSSLVAVSVRDVVNGGELISHDVVSLFGAFIAIQDRSAVDQARDSMMLDTASGRFLTAIGANHGVPRPPQSPFDDDLYRKIIPILAWLPKTPYLVTYRLAEAIFGTQAEVLDSVGYAWQIYEVRPNEIIFECPLDLIAGSASVAAYMHGFSGNTLPTVGLTSVVTSIGFDARSSVANNNLNIRTMYVFHTGVWNAYTILSATYNAGTSTNTFTLNAATVPTGNNFPFFIDVPGVNSWNPGDFMLTNATMSAGEPDHPNTPSLVYLFGKARFDIFEFYMNNFVRAAGVSLRSEVL